MVSWAVFLVTAVLGAALGVASLASTRRAAVRTRDPARFEARAWALFLVVAALIYVGFAWGLGASERWLRVELMGVAAYGALALFGVLRAPKWVGFGWLLHALWDLVVHPGGHPGYVPSWYPATCLGFDVVVGSWCAIFPGPRVQQSR